MQKATHCHFEGSKQKSMVARGPFFGRSKPQKDVSNACILPKKKKALKRKISMKTEVSENLVVIHLPLIAESEANNFEHWTKKHKRHILQKRTVAIALNSVRNHLTLPIHIKLVRLAPRKLDKWDNLPMSVKYILDACCAIVTQDFRPGRADDDPRISVSYDQITSKEYGVIVSFSCPFP